MPEGFHDFEEPEDWLTFDEIQRVIRVFSELGVRRVRLTGGEPLVRKNITELASTLSNLPGVDDLSLSTNATRMEKYADALFQSGIKRINASLDSLNPETFKQITKGKLDKVINGLMAAKVAGFAPIKINMVVMKGINDHEVEDMVEFCIEHGFTLRFIETMPVGDTGRDASDQFISLQTIEQRLAQRYELIPGMMPGGGPARYVQVAGTELRIGFITPISQHFCETCNRVRLSVDGTLYMCLGQDDKYELRPLLRAGINDDELKEHIIKAIAIKPSHHEFNEKPEQVIRFMSMTGG
jgi:cyclic pyranopterin phosphate synthase